MRLFEPFPLLFRTNSSYKYMVRLLCLDGTIKVHQHHLLVSLPYLLILQFLSPF